MLHCGLVRHRTLQTWFGSTEFQAVFLSLRVRVPGTNPFRDPTNNDAPRDSFFRISRQEQLGQLHFRANNLEEQDSKGTCKSTWNPTRRCRRCRCSGVRCQAPERSEPSCSKKDPSPSVFIGRVSLGLVGVHHFWTETPPY